MHQPLLDHLQIAHSYQPCPCKALIPEIRLELRLYIPRHEKKYLFSETYNTRRKSAHSDFSATVPTTHPAIRA